MLRVQSKITRHASHQQRSQTEWLITKRTLVLFCLHIYQRVKNMSWQLNSRMQGLLLIILL